MLKIINRKIKAHAFVEMLDKLSMWRTVDKLVFHHTSSPIDTWRGSASMLHYYNIYQSRGWKSGPHIFVAPDGLWLFTPIEKEGTHAGPEGRKRSIGIELVGRYNDELPTNETICRLTAVVTYYLMKRFNLEPKDLYTHHQFEPDSFCSPTITSGWLQANMAQHMDYILEVDKLIAERKLQK